MLPVNRSKLTQLSSFFLGACISAGSAFAQAKPEPAQPPAAPADAQPTAPGQAPPVAPGQAQPGGGGGDDRRAQMDQFRKTMEDRMKTLLAASDDEFAVLKPRIDKIQQEQMSNDSRRVGFAMLMGNNGPASWRTRPSNPGEGQQQPKPADNGDKPPPRPSVFGNLTSTPTYEKAQELQTVLESKDATSDTLKAKLAELRALKLAAKQELARSQEELRQLCSVRQEAVLVMMGILE